MSSNSRLWAVAILFFALALAIGSALTPSTGDHVRAGTNAIPAAPANIFSQPGGLNTPDGQFLEPTTPMDHA